LHKLFYETTLGSVAGAHVEKHDIRNSETNFKMFLAENPSHKWKFKRIRSKSIDEPIS
jgi:hypothetical protein